MRPKRVRVQGRILEHLDRAQDLIQSEMIRTDGNLALALAEIDEAIGELLVHYGNAMIMKGAPIKGATLQEIARRVGVTFPGLNLDAINEPDS